MTLPRRTPHRECHGVRFLDTEHLVDAVGPVNELVDWEVGKRLAVVRPDGLVLADTLH